jgi:hypothetical protein
MIISYYPETDLIYIDLSAKDSSESKEVSPGVVIAKNHPPASFALAFPTFVFSQLPRFLFLIRPSSKRSDHPSSICFASNLKQSAPPTLFRTS